LYSLVLAAPMIWPKEAPVADGPALAVATTALVAVAPLVAVTAGVGPPQDAAITSANARTAELPLITTRSP